MRNIYAIVDNKAGHDPVAPMLELQMHNVVALRNFQDVMQGNNPIAKYPEDFDLVCLGYIHPETGHIVPAYDVIMKGADMAALLKENNKRDVVEATATQTELRAIKGGK